VKASKQRTKTTVWLENNRECHLYTNIASNGKLASANTQKRYVHVFSEYQRRLCSSSTSILYLGRRRLQRKRPHDRAEGARRRLRRRHREEISILSKMLSFSIIFKKRFRFLQRLFGVMNAFSNEQCTDALCRAIARRQRLFLARNEKSKIRERKGSERKIQNLLGRAGRCKQIAHNQASRGERLRKQRNRILNLPFQSTLDSGTTENI